MTRRQLLERTHLGSGSLTLASLLQLDGVLATATSSSDGQPARHFRSNDRSFVDIINGRGVQGDRSPTGPVGYASVEHPVHPNDLHAIMLHHLGLDQHRLYYERHDRREPVIGY